MVVDHAVGKVPTVVVVVGGTVEVNGVELPVAAQIVEAVAVLGVELAVGALVVVAFAMDGVHLMVEAPMVAVTTVVIHGVGLVAVAVAGVVLVVAVPGAVDLMAA
jgi:hypothetical protein